MAVINPSDGTVLQSTPLSAVAFDKAAFAKKLRKDALPPFGNRQCAFYVRKALESAGMATGKQPENAKDYGPYLTARGFVAVASFVVNDGDNKGIDGNYVPQVGDVAVIQSTSTSAPGHIEGYDGTNWISDFVQSGFWPGPGYRSEKPNYTVYRR